MNKFNMERVGLMVTMACNLNCRLCGTYAPYRKGEQFFSATEQEAVIKRYFEIVSYVKKFTFSGGEPQLFSELPRLFSFVQKYLDQIGIVEIVTNGTIVPSKELIDAAKGIGKQMIFLVDDYGMELSPKIQEIHDTLKSAAIPFVVRKNDAVNIDDAYYGGWVDYGDGLQKIMHSQEEMEILFSKCAQPQKYKFCFPIYKGIMYPCEPVKRCMEFGTTARNTDEFIDLLDDTVSIEQQRNKIRKIYEMKCFAACAFCKGICDDSKRYLPAQQLTTEELLCVSKGARSYREVCEMMKNN